MSSPRFRALHPGASSGRNRGPGPASSRPQIFPLNPEVGALAQFKVSRQSAKSCVGSISITHGWAADGRSPLLRASSNRGRPSGLDVTPGTQTLGRRLWDAAANNGPSAMSSGVSFWLWRWILGLVSGAGFWGWFLGRPYGICFGRWPRADVPDAGA